MNARPLLVGEDNPQGNHPLSLEPANGAGARLCRILGLEASVYLGLDRANLCVSKWDANRARARAKMLTAHGTPFRTIVMLGAKVRAAFGHALGRKFKEWDAYRETAAVCENPSFAPLTLLAFPHPSGRCQAWNNAAAIERARAMLREYVPNVSWGST